MLHFARLLLWPDNVTTSALVPDQGCRTGVSDPQNFNSFATLTSPRIPIKFPEHIFSALSNFGSRIPVCLDGNWEAGANPALPRNC
jgi:hypothetical protein